MEKNPLVSIITPVYNHGSYINSCIESVLAQTFPGWEMIIMDDGSTDETGDIVKTYTQRDERIRYFRQENKGIFRLGETYNQALSYARGEYISILEGDDLWMPDKLERQVAMLEADPMIVLAWGQAGSVRHESDEKIDLKPDVYGINPSLLCNNPIGSILNLQYIENIIPAVTMTFRREALEQVGGFQQSHRLPLVDLPTILALARLGTFWFDHRLLAKWRVYGFQVTKTYPVEITLGRMQLCLDHYDSNPAGIRDTITITKESMVMHFRRVLHIAYSRSGRYKLIRKDFKDARNDFRKAIFFRGSANIPWRIRAITGLVMSYFNTDLEGLSTWFGKGSYKTR